MLGVARTSATATPLKNLNAVEIAREMDIWKKAYIVVYRILECFYQQSGVKNYSYTVAFLQTRVSLTFLSKHLHLLPLRFLTVPSDIISQKFEK